MAAAFSHSSAAADKTPTSRTWTFEDGIPGHVHGLAECVEGVLVPPVYPSFSESNKVLRLDAPAWLSLPDEDDFCDFDNGDTITLEAWVQINSIGENVCLISKGRTGRTGNSAINQNWALRLRRASGKACLNFLFRSRETDEHSGGWHRWTSKEGFASGPRWHHVAVSYRFGSPDSISGWIDGKKVAGSWDMSGPTEHPPVVDDDDVLIGSTMAGVSGNSLDGSIDNIIVHRTAVRAEDLQARYQRVPPVVRPPQIPTDSVLMQMFGPLASKDALPEETEQPLIEWHQPELAFVRLPRRFDDRGVRDDWGSCVLVRAWARVHLPAGEHRILVRSRGLSSLQIDGAEVLRTPAQNKYGSAHGVVDELPEVPFAGMRPAAMGDREVIVRFSSPGKEHLVRYDVIVGGPKYRPEFGEGCVAIAPPVGMFYLLSPVTQIPLTDAGWQTFYEMQSTRLDAQDRQRRREAAAQTTQQWAERHSMTRQLLLKGRRPESIDAVIENRLREVRAAQETVVTAATKAQQHPSAAYFSEHIQPLFESYCTRCHIQRQHGGLSLKSHSNLLTGGESGQPSVVPGDPDHSYLLELVSAAQGEYRMPPKGEGLTQSEVKAIAEWIRMGAQMPSDRVDVQIPEATDDFTFLRRIYLDTVGVPPTPEEIDAFFADSQATRRNNVIDRLLKDDRWADHWTGYWQDVLAENPNLLKPTLNNTGPFRFWIHDALEDNKPIDRFATELIMMRGSAWSGGSAGFGIASQNDVPMAAKGHVISSAFLGVNLKCARCHDAPWHQWKQQELFQIASMLQRRPVKLPESSTVPAAFFNKSQRQPLIEVSLKPGVEIHPEFPFTDLADEIPAELQPGTDDPRYLLATQITLSRRFAQVIANRVWQRLMGAGIVEPVDDWDGNPPEDAALLEALADHLIDADFDIKKFARRIFQTRVYQRRATDIPEKGKRLFLGPYRRRMTAEQVVDSAILVTGGRMQTEMLTLDLDGNLPADKFLNFGYPRRAWELTTLANERDRPSLALPRAQAVVDVLKAFGWRDSRAEPLTDRAESTDLIQPAILSNGTLSVWLCRLTDESRLTTMMRQPQSLDQLIDRLYTNMLTRLPTEAERNEMRALLQPGFESRIVPEDQIGTPHEPRRFRYVSWSNHLNSEANLIKLQMQEHVRKGPPPTRYLKAEWRMRAEDAVWSLLNSPEMVIVP